MWKETFFLPKHDYEEKNGSPLQKRAVFKWIYMKDNLALFFLSVSFPTTYTCIIMSANQKQITTVTLFLPDMTDQSNSFSLHYCLKFLFLVFSFGVFYMELIDYFGQSKGETALVGSTLMGMHLIFGMFKSS